MRNQKFFNIDNTIIEEILETKLTRYVKNILEEKDDKLYININDIKQIVPVIGGSRFDYLYHFDKDFECFTTDYLETCYLTSDLKEFIKEKDFHFDTDEFSEYVRNNLDLDFMEIGVQIYNSLGFYKPMYSNQKYDSMIPFDLVIRLYLLYSDCCISVILHKDEICSLPDFKDEIISELYQEIRFNKS
jgi:hypothetical protein